MRWKLAAAVIFAGDDEPGYPLNQPVWQVECGSTKPTRLLCLWVETSNTSPTAREPRALRASKPSPVQWPR